MYSNILSLKSILLVVIVLMLGNSVFSQLQFTQEERLLFVGTEVVNEEQIVVGVYIIPIDSFNLNLEIDILANWKTKDKITTTVRLDSSSLKDSTFTIARTDDDHYSAYRFYNDEGFEVLIAKEQFHEAQSNSNIRIKPYTMSFAKIILPKENKYYVNSLPLMFNK